MISVVHCIIFGNRIQTFFQNVLAHIKVHVPCMKLVYTGKISSEPEVISSIGLSLLFIEMVSSIFKLSGKVRLLSRC